MESCFVSRGCLPKSFVGMRPQSPPRLGWPQNLKSKFPGGQREIPFVEGLSHTMSPVKSGKRGPTLRSALRAHRRRDGFVAQAKESDHYGHVCYNRGMRTVKISDLKARLSAHLQFVREGQEVVVCDRHQPVARIVPIRPEDFSEHEKRLVARGILTPRRKGRNRSQAWPVPPGNVSDEVMEQVWREEREGR